MVEQLLHFNKRYLSSCGYLVCINKVLLGFSKVSGLVMEMDSEAYVEGGNGALPYIMRKKESNNKILTFEKGISKGFDQTVLWAAVPGCRVDDILIIVKRNTFEIDKVFYVEEGVITKISYSNLDAASSDILTISFELSHSGLMEMNPSSAVRYL